MMRLMIIATTSLGTAILSAATPAIFQASWSSRFRLAFEGLTLTSWLIIVPPPSGALRAIKPQRTRFGLQDQSSGVLRSDAQPERQAALIAYRRGTGMLLLSAKES